MRPIDADKLVEEYKRLLQRFEEIGDNSAATAIELCRHKAECVAPTLDIKPMFYVKSFRDDQGLWRCTGCLRQIYFPHFEYCPRCGAKMDLR